jgi:hypothetical protein
MAGGRSASDETGVSGLVRVSAKLFPLAFLATPFWAMPKRCSYGGSSDTEGIVRNLRYADQKNCGAIKIRFHVEELKSKAP